ncbi:sigma-E factor negative regulatory protein [Lysobacter sp. A03]|uniref:sigma-E factor negative regulatory protein n=1 Tax=Lysobacter sp. A03 TaxID=1199154 RepID=UPI0005B74655|nr:sigma-E factor negative regulatory protein [Lysobacter sp. A03]KIQ97985.1 Sigma factor RpoE negative regulatory protein RseA [Lysobacter sp. A03]
MSNMLMSNTHSDGSGAGELSALFDGQLGPDEARFALKRLGGDAGWREACGRWQLAGDALRGDGVAPAPSGFADRVMAAVGREQEHAVLTDVRTRRGPVRHKPRWLGGALAASVAIAALFVARPMLDGEDPAADAPTGRELVSTAGAAASVDSPAPLIAGTGSGSKSKNSAPDDATTIQTGAAAAALAASAMASTSPDASRRSEPRQRSVGRTVAGSRAQSPDASVAAPAGSGPARSGPVPATADSARVRPFTPDAIASKPWPRAAVPGFHANAGMTVGFTGGNEAGVPISFYPFEPATLRSDPVSGAVEREPLPTSHMLPEPSAGAVIRH